MYCGKCGKLISDNSKFCKYCGAIVNLTEDVNAEKTLVKENIRFGKDNLLKDRKLISIISIVTAVILIACIGLLLCLHKKIGEPGNLVGNNRIVNIEQIDGRACILGNPERFQCTYIVRDYDADGNEYSVVERNYNFFVYKAEMNIYGQSDSTENGNIIYRYDYDEDDILEWCTIEASGMVIKIGYYCYDGGMDATWYDDGGNIVLTEKYKYTYDEKGNIVSYLCDIESDMISNQKNTTTAELTYDNDNNLIAEKIYTDNNGIGQIILRYDEDGNPTYFENKQYINGKLSEVITLDIVLDNL